MAKKPAPSKSKAKPMGKKASKTATKSSSKPSAKAASKTAAKSSKTSSSAKGGKLAAAVKGIASVFKGKEKASLKSDSKKDVKPPVSSKLVGKNAVKKGEPSAGVSMSKASASKKTSELKGKASVPPAAPAKPLTKPLKIAKAPKKASAPKNYDDMCREISCESSSSTAGYCRLHYIKNWKKIKRKELILREKKLNQYIEELVSKYPDKYIEAIKNDLADEVAFSKVIYDLELDDSVDDIPADDEADEAIIDNIKREFDDSDSDF